MTKTTSSMVIAVSAMLVESIIFRTPGGGRLKTFFCSADGIMECRERMTNFLGSLKYGQASSLSLVWFMSSHPGRKTRTAPSTESTQIFLSSRSMSRVSISSGLTPAMYLSSSSCPSVGFDPCFFCMCSPMILEISLWLFCRAQSRAVLPSFAGKLQSAPSERSMQTSATRPLPARTMSGDVPVADCWKLRTSGPGREEISSRSGSNSSEKSASSRDSSKEDI